MESCSNLVANKRVVPPGILIAKAIKGKDFKVELYRTLVLVITFIAYACYHASRKPPSIVKSVLDPERTSRDPTVPSSRLSSSSPHPWPLNWIFIPQSYDTSYSASNLSMAISSTKSTASGWAPFNGEDGKVRLGEIDVAFLACYAFGMFFAGHFGDRLDLRLFLTIGMIGSGTFVCLFGMGYWWQIHNLYYFLFVQMMAGLFQATGWPSVVAIVGNWCGKTKRGLIMGVWNAHTSIGNIFGSLIAASVLTYGWGWSFLLPGLSIMLAGILVYLFLVVDPGDVGLPSPYEVQAAHEQTGEPSHRNSVRINGSSSEGEGSSRSDTDEETSLSDTERRHHKDGDRYIDEEAGLIHKRAKSPQRDQPVGFVEAWMIPGVAPFAFCLFFAKLVAYTFLYWLPFYIRHTRIAGEILSEKTSGNLSTMFDIGGVVGGVMAGHISDRLNARAITAATFMYCAIPALFLYHQYGAMSMSLNVGLMMLLGMLVNGPYALITTAVSADLGTHSTLRGDARALATVTAIIDGCGSVGAAVGPLLTGYISQNGWDNVFIMLMLSAFIAGLLLSRLVAAEASEKLNSFRNSAKDSGGEISQPLMS